MKSKYWNCVFAVLLAGLLFVGVMGLFTAPVTPDFVAETQAVSNRPLVPYLVYLETEETDDTWFILVDLSDRANYPHVHTNKIILKSLHYMGDVSAAEEWHFNYGVVTAVTTATTDIEWFTGGTRVKATQFDERYELSEHGLSLMVVGGSLDRVATFEITSTASITSGTEISTTIGVTGTVGVGDLILLLDEIAGTSTVHFATNVGYNTE